MTSQTVIATTSEDAQHKKGPWLLAPVFVRYPFAVVAGVIIGEIGGIPVAALLDLAFRANVTGGRWPLTTANVILVCIKGLITGYSAGGIAQKYGKSIGALANLLPLFAVVIIFLIMNRNLTEYNDIAFDTRPDLWVYFGLLPAMLGGHLGVKYGLKGLSKTVLGWHWLWFLPLCAVVLSLIERQTVAYAFAVFKLGWQRWSWGVFISPSAGFCFSVVVASVVWPVLGLCSIAFVVAARQPWRYALLLIAAIFLMPFVAEALIWGSFPFIFDGEGVGRLRMIPFIPWPSGEYGEY